MHTDRESKCRPKIRPQPPTPTPHPHPPNLEGADELAEVTASVCDVVLPSAIAESIQRLQQAEIG
jgi:hypothetical protein